MWCLGREKALKASVLVVMLVQTTCILKIMAFTGTKTKTDEKNE